jgi:MFS family permease
MSRAVTPAPPSPPRAGNLLPAPDLTLPWWAVPFRALRHRNYRLYFLGQLVSLVGSWVQTTALMWLAYKLTGQSRWPALIAAVQVLPTFVLGPWGGHLADRWPRRPLIFATQAALLALAVLLGVLVLYFRVTPWHLLAVSLAVGLVNAADLPARLAFVMEMVGRDDLINAVALNSVLFNVARAVGPALGAWCLGLVGPGTCFLINGLSFVAVLAALALMTLPWRVAPAAHHEERASLWAGFRYLAGRPALVLLLVLTGALSLFGWPVLSLLPALADQHLHRSEGGYGSMLSALGAGAMLAALLVATFGSLGRSRLFLGAGAMLSAASLVCLSYAASLPAAVACCAGLGCGLILFFATGQSVMQLSSREHNRGRVMGVWSMVTSGGLPVGSLLAGWAADAWGVPYVVLLLGLGIAVAAAAVLLAALAMGGLAARHRSLSKG